MNPKEKKSQKKKKIEVGLSLEKINYQILIVGIIVIIAGYIALAQKPWDGFFALTIAPILLVVGYCVIIPFGIIYKKKKNSDTISNAQ